ncbi:MAG: site-specific integrase [Marmoricola sp.]
MRHSLAWHSPAAYPCPDGHPPSPQRHHEPADPHGLPPGRTSGFVASSPHRCRHSFATNPLRSGANIREVQQLMRHASLNTTAVYTAV